MGYIQEVERKFRHLYRNTPVDRIEDELATFVNEKVLESYKNGIKEGKKPKKKKA